MSVESKIRTSVINNSTVAALIRDRFYEGQIASILGSGARVDFPCGTFQFIGGIVDTNIKKIQMANFNLWAWSEKSYDEAKKIYDAIFDVLQNQRLTDSEVRFVCFESGRPIRSYDDTSKTFVLMGVFRAQIIEI